MGNKNTVSNFYKKKYLICHFKKCELSKSVSKQTLTIKKNNIDLTSKIFLNYWDVFSMFKRKRSGDQVKLDTELIIFTLNSGKNVIYKTLNDKYHVYFNTLEVTKIYSIKLLNELNSIWYTSHKKIMNFPIFCFGSKNKISV